MKRKLLYGFLFLLILVAVLFGIFSLDKPFVVDEVDFIRAGEALAETGKPIIYHSEQKPVEVTLWHPPFYIFLLSAIAKLVDGDIFFRLANFFVLILTSVLIFIFCRNFVKDKNRNFLGILASSLFLINYYVFSSALRIDIDVFSMFFLFGFLISWLRYLRDRRKIYYISSIIFLVLSISNRYIIAFLVYFFIGIYFLCDKEKRKDFFKYLFIGIVALVIFLCLWVVYSEIIEPGNFFYFFTHNSGFAKEMVSNPFLYIGSFGINLLQFFKLFSLPGVILLGMSIFYFLRKRNYTTNFLLIYSLPTFLFFVLLPRPAFGYPRYFLSVIPAFILLVSFYSYNRLKKFKPSKDELLFLVIGVLFSFLVLIIFCIGPVIYSGRGLIISTNIFVFFVMMFSIFPIFFSFFINGENRKKFFILMLIALHLVHSAYFVVNSSLYENNLLEVGEYIKNNTNENELIIAPKEVAYYSERKFYNNENNKPKLDFSKEFILEYLIKSSHDFEMKNSFFWPKSLYSGINYPSPQFSELREVRYVVLYHGLENYIPEKVIGDYHIYNLGA